MELDKMITNEDLDKAYDRQLNRLISSKKRFDVGQLSDEQFTRALKRTLNNLAEITAKKHIVNDNINNLSRLALKFVRGSLLNDIDNLLNHYVEQITKEIEPDIGLFEVLDVASLIKVALELPLAINNNNGYPRA